MSRKNSSAKIKIPKILNRKLNNKKVYQIYEKFEKTLNIQENFIVAVSGGPDSLALAFLAKIYSIKKKLNCKFFIVDHKLRVESTKEAKSTQQVLKKKLIKAEILAWKGKKPLNNIQSIARKKRYELLFKKCERFKINNILLGHHQDDLFENFFIRILRGSGLKGLISLDKKSIIDNKNLLRPLLNQRKDKLVFLTQHVFGYYAKDPSNNDEKFQRIKIRKLTEKLKNEGLDTSKFFQTIKNLKYSNTVIEFYVKKNLQKNTFYSNNKKELILNNSFFKQPHEVVFRSLSESIKLIGKKHYFVRGKKLDKIIEDIDKNRLYRVTLGGCIIEKVNQTVIISIE